MKKVITLFLILFLLTGCIFQRRTDKDFKIAILKNLNKISEKVKKKENYNIIKNKYYRRIIHIGENAVPIIISLYNEKKLDETEKYISAKAVEEITGCSLQDNYNLTWDNPDDFFAMWQNNNCKNKEMKDLSSNAKNLVLTYPEFYNLTKECKIKIPILKNMIPQGITIMDKYILITEYHNSKREKSKCIVLNQEGEIVNIVTLNTTSHVGGIAYDEKNNFLWLPGDNGSLDVYLANEFLIKKEVKALYTFNNISDGLINYKNKDKNQIAYLTIYKNHIYIGNFSLLGKSIVKKFAIINNANEFILTFIAEYYAPSKIQGITFFAKDNNDFVLLSRSYGRHNHSQIYVYRISDDKNAFIDEKKVLKIKLPPLLEQITVHNNTLYTIFESNAPTYESCNDKMESICLLDQNKIVEEYLKNELDYQINMKEKENKKKK